MIDYKALLLKYINHVAENEGVTFIKDTWRNEDMFSKAEWDELVKLDDEAWAQLNGEVKE